MQPESAKFRQRGLGGNEDILGCHPRPDRVERFQPVEEIGILGCRNRAGEGLIKMVVGVDQSRQNQVPAQIKDFISCRQAVPR